MGDRLRASKPSRYVTSHLGQLSLLSLRGRQIEYRPVWLGWRQGVLTCVGYQVTLRDPTWQVTLRIAASWGYPLTAYSIPSYLYSPRSFLFLLVVLLLLRRPPSLRLCRFKSDCRLLGLSSPTFPRVGQCHDDPDLQKYWYISNLGTRQNVAGRKRQIFRTMSDNCATWSRPYAERSYCGSLYIMCLRLKNVTHFIVVMSLSDVIRFCQFLAESYSKEFVACEQYDQYVYIGLRIYVQF